MANGIRQTTIWRDAKGSTAAVRWWVSSAGTALTQQTAAANVQGTIPALTNAAFQSAHGPNNSVAREAVLGTSATYEDVEDKAVFTFQGADGSFHRYQIPAPVTSIFLSDGQTVDPANTAVVAFTSAIIANATSADGSAVAFFIGGLRSRRKIQRRLNIFRLTPTLTVGEPAE